MLPRGPSEVQFVVQLLHFINVEWLTPTTSKCGHFEQIFFWEGNFICVCVCLRICFENGKILMFYKLTVASSGCDATHCIAFLWKGLKWRKCYWVPFHHPVQRIGLLSGYWFSFYQKKQHTHNFAKHFKSNQIRNWNFQIFQMTIL